MEEKSIFENFFSKLQELNKLIYNPDNLFKILKLENLEIRHSNFLVWLMEQDEYKFLKKIFDLVKIDYKDLYFSDIEIMRENNHIDILIVSKKSKFVCVIENKIFASEHGFQLDKYEDVIKNKYKDFTCHFVYLTVNAEIPSNKNYKPFSHKNISEEILTDDFINNLEISKRAKDLVKDYKQVLNEDIIKIPDKNSNVFKLCKDLTENYADILFQFKNNTTEKIKKKYGDEIEFLYETNINAINKIYICQKQIKQDRDTKIKNILKNIIKEEYSECIREHGKGKWGYVIDIYDELYKKDNNNKLLKNYPFKMIDYTALPFEDYYMHLLCGLTADKSRKIVKDLTNNTNNILKNCQNLSKNWSYKMGLWIKLNRMAQATEAIYFTKQNEYEYVEYLKKHNNIVGVKQIDEAKDILEKLKEFSDKNEFEQLSSKINMKDYKELTLLPCLCLDYKFKDIDNKNEDKIVQMYKEKTLEGLSIFGLDEDFKKYLKL